MTQEQAHPVIFTGNGWEYFKIYFVNIMLSILTLGIYSAWAKVRNKRYFYGHTSVAGSGFDYHAVPMQILKGRFIVVGILILYNLAVSFVPLITPLFSLLFFFGIPFLIMRATKFNMQYSSHRQIRFNFIGEYLYVFFHFIVLPLASIFTLGLAYPYAVYKQKQYLSNHTKYGDSRFTFSGTSGQFFLTYFLGFFLLFATYFVILNSFNIIDAGTWEAFKQGFTEGLNKSLNRPDALYADDENKMRQVYMILAGVYGFLIINILLFTTFVNARLTNYLFNNLQLKTIRFSSHISFLRLLWIYISNLLLIMLTLGLFIPWAKVRAVQYKLSCITLFSNDLGSFYSEEEEKAGVLGEEFSDFLDIDIGF
jgi:uncharacterized membrane protein YjgN (DUF898 family)